MPKLISQKNNYNEVVTYKTTNSTSQSIIDRFSKNQFQSAKYQIQIENNNTYQTTEILVVHNGTSTYNVEYQTILTNSNLASFDSNLSGTNIQLLATPMNSSETKFTLIRKTIN
jgi:hypothetical protein